MRVRFAPSPTGLLHLGNARTAIVNWLAARQAGGIFLLRIDDTDIERSRPELALTIDADLAWLGLDVDERAVQSQRTAVYERHFAGLAAGDRLYPAYETPEELAAMRQRLKDKNLPPRYDRTSLRLAAADRQRLEAEGRKPHWRLRLSDRRIDFVDRVRGPQRIDLRHLSDPVLRRADGSFTYTFASVVDDLDLGVTEVIRGEDHLTNTAVQIDLMEALGGRPPDFGHLPLILDAGGQKVSKRLGAATLADLREQGVEPLAILQVLAALGTGRPACAEATLAELVAGFDLAAFGTAQPRLATADIARHSAAVLHHLDFVSVQARLEGMGLAGLDQPFWNAIRANLERLEDAGLWWSICQEPLQPVIEDSAYLATAANLLGQSSSVEAWLDALKEASGRKGKALFHPLRLALTARERGPDLGTLLALMGKDRAVMRLRGQVA
ncbi:glutamyl-tRNA synthetase [Arboricoccus pini]|uniref:Glutamate--tRNA ligase n=1 Tax=Arboricoccus pini TaxID=1963835 RepID=A0A212RBZ1_9PROT|nr:glutamate--tRNA ligase [Arboricoccus pini]SNB69694.1 glutamyl-tRNA synthetase [Arboricoccus pini]